MGSRTARGVLELRRTSKNVSPCPTTGFSVLLIGKTAERLAICFQIREGLILARDEMIDDVLKENAINHKHNRHKRTKWRREYTYSNRPGKVQGRVKDLKVSECGIKMGELLVKCLLSPSTVGVQVAEVATTIKDSVNDEGMANECEQRLKSQF
ncbi:hypothetical protein EVAR_48034_1 [Eumeta japonica]|uniref:Uncharacterized protein n=1 Tax=Eumeta variegata TaxID=151549 RepID=A0A4C1XK57_EUMVA|nr:hypothetical protein EVAR_48034_1 [Eumeta japonica]